MSSLSSQEDKDDIDGSSFDQRYKQSLFMTHYEGFKLQAFDKDGNELKIIVNPNLGLI